MVEVTFEIIERTKEWSKEKTLEYEDLNMILPYFCRRVMKVKVNNSLPSKEKQNDRYQSSCYNFKDATNMLEIAVLEQQTWVGEEVEVLINANQAPKTKISVFNKTTRRHESPYCR